MTDNIYVYVVDLPGSITEMVCPCFDGYTVYLNARASSEAQKEGYLHALYHIQNHDFEREDDIQTIESEAHRRKQK